MSSLEGELIRLYIQTIPKKGKITVDANIITSKGIKNVVKGVFSYRTIVDTTNESYNESYNERWSSINYHVKDGVFCCIAYKNDQIISIGTAFAVTENDLITNAHVIKDSDEILIFNKDVDNNTIQVSLKNTNEVLDLAWLQLNNTNIKLKKLDIDWRYEPKNADQVAAFGYPYDTFASDDCRLKCSYGIVKGLTKNQENQDIILHDANIASGNSGGPLVNLSGKVIGVNQMITFNKIENEMRNKQSGAIRVSNLEIFKELKEKLNYK